MTPEELIRIGIRLRDVRLQRGVSQKELAARASLSTTQISSIEHGRHITLDSVVALATVLDVSLDYIIRGIRPQAGAWGLIFRSDDELDDRMVSMMQ